MRITGTISLFLKKWPLHLLLLPIFFIASVYVQLAGLLRVSEAAMALLKVTCYLLLLFALLYLFYKDRNKAGIAATLGGTVFLFFGTIKDMLHQLPLLEYISSYKVLLPLLLLLALFLLYKLKKIRRWENTTLFLNILFILYLGMEVWQWIGVSGYEKKGSGYDLSLQPQQSGIAKLPGIYYIVLDCYPSSMYQQEVLGVTSNPLDSILAAKGFFVIPGSKSNYHLTSFSLAATFGMDYLDWIKEAQQAKPYHYSRSATAVKQSPMFGWLKQNGYTLYNLSIFDLPGQPSVNKERFFSATSSEIIFYNTVSSKLKWELLPSLFPSMNKRLVTEQLENVKTLSGHFKQYNEQVLDSLQSIFSITDSITRKFVYAHLEMPHYPYFYDAAGKAYSDTVVFSPSMATDKNMFRNYIGYTNRIINNLLDSLLHYNTGRDIIIIQSDHGTNNLDPSRKKDAFLNYSAFYFPDRDYLSLYPGMSNVNTFRIIFNKYFGQRLPLLKDSSIYIN